MPYTAISYQINQIVLHRKIIDYRCGKYVAECQICGTIYTGTVKSIKRDICICKLDVKTIAIKQKIADVLEMFFGHGKSILEISKKFNSHPAGIACLISRYGFKKQDGITITLKSKV